MSVWSASADPLGQRAPPGPPKRIVSINACADQLLLALADAGQIVALTRYASDPSMSSFVATANRFRQIDGAAEEVLKLSPDLVLAGRFTRRATRLRLTQLGLQVKTLKPARTLDDVRSLIRETAAIVGHPARGDAALAALDGAVRRAGAVAQGLTALNLQRRGFVAGSGTLLDAMLSHVGVANAARQLGLSSVRRTTLEHIVKLKPEVLIVSEGAARAEDQGAAMLLHPAIMRVVPPDRRVLLPSRTVICGGPQNAEALDILRAAFAQKRGPT